MAMEKDKSKHLPSYEPCLMGKNRELIRVFQEGKNADVHIMCGASITPIPCHRLLFMLHSPVLETMITQRWTESLERGDSSVTTITLPEDDPEILKVLIGFFYYDQELQNMTQALKLIEMAHKYDCPHIVTFCSKYIQNNLSLETVLNIYQVSCLIGNDELITASNKYISTNIRYLIYTGEFLDMRQSDLIQFLEDKNRKTGIQELDIFNCIYNWTKAECHRSEKASRDDIVETIRPLLKYVNLSRIPFTDFTTQILPRNILTHDATIRAYQSYSQTSKTGVKLDFYDLVRWNCIERLESTHSLKYTGRLGENVTLTEIRFTYDGERSIKDSVIKILVGVNMDGVKRYYSNDPEDQLCVKFLPDGLTPKIGGGIEIFWSEKFEFERFPIFSAGKSISAVNICSSNGYKWFFRSTCQPQPLKSKCPLKFLCLL